MNTEEKAKAYDEALRKIRPLYERAKKEDCPIWSTYEYIFPELAESEDEKIRITIIEAVKALSTEWLEIFGASKDDILAWLEKQKEQKPVNPSDAELQRHQDELYDFKVFATKQAKERQPVKNITLSREETLHQLLQNGLITMFDYLYLIDKQKPEGGNSEKPNNQWSEDFEENIRMLLNDKLTWQSEDGGMSTTVLIDDKTLKDIVQGIWFYVGKEALKYPNKELNVIGWSEEDEGIRRSIVARLEALLQYETQNLPKAHIEHEISWLKSLRPQPKQKDRYQEGFQDGMYEGRRKAWEEYNKSVAYHYEDFNHKLSCRKEGPCTNPFFDCVNCPRMDNNSVKTYTSPNITEYQSWMPSEEEKKKLFADGFRDARHTLATIFMKYLDENRPDGKMCLANGECIALERAFEIGDVEKIIRYFKKYQCDWKPSEEQMETLKFVIGNHIFGHQEHQGILESLYNDLKKL